MLQSQSAGEVQLALSTGRADGCGAEAEGGEEAGGAEQGEGAVFGGALAAFFGGLEVVVAGEVEPAVDDVAEELFREGQVVAGGVGEGGVHGDADVAGVVEGGIALEGDDIGRSRIVEKVGVEAGEGGVGEESDGEFAKRDAARGSDGVFQLGAGAAAAGGGEGGEIGGGEAEIGVEAVEGAGEHAAVEAELRVAIVDGEFAHGGESGGGRDGAIGSEGEAKGEGVCRRVAAGGSDGGRDDILRVAGCGAARGCHRWRR